MLPVCSMVLIGSRALHHHGAVPGERISPQTDYDFVATQPAALAWLAALEVASHETVVWDKVVHALDRASHDADIVKDIGQWKHFSQADGQALYAQVQGAAGITKLHGHTSKLRFEIEVAEPALSAYAVLQTAERLGAAVDTGSTAGGYWIAPLAVLEAIKTAHVVFPHHFAKHVADLHAIRRAMAAPTATASATASATWRDPALQRLVVQRRIEHYLMHGVPGFHLNLNQTNDGFLEGDDAVHVERYIKHDDLHELVKLDTRPAYDNLRADRTKALMSKALFEQADRAQQLNCVREECMSIALERYLLPGRVQDAQQAYARALARVCTTLTKGWFREFALDAYPEVAHVPAAADLLAVRDRVLAEHQERVDEEHARLLAAADRDHLIEHGTYQDRIGLLFPLIFAAADELALARAMGKQTSTCWGGRWYRTRYGTLDMVFAADTGYEYADGGWCNRYSEWYAYVMVQSHAKAVNWEPGVTTVPEERLRDLGCRLHLIYRQREDDSFSASPSLRTAFADTLANVYEQPDAEAAAMVRTGRRDAVQQTLGSRLLAPVLRLILLYDSVTPITEEPGFSEDFLRRFVLGIAWPPQMPHGGPAGGASGDGSGNNDLYVRWATLDDQG